LLKQYPRFNKMDSDFYREYIDDERYFKEYNGLCQHCRGINIESISKPGGYLHASSYRGLKDRTHCILCDRLCGLLGPSEVQGHSKIIGSNTNSSFPADGVQFILHRQPSASWLLPEV